MTDFRDFRIKDNCEKCGGTDNLDGVIYPQILTDGELLVENATLCSPCREEFEKFLEEQKKS